MYSHILPVRSNVLNLVREMTSPEDESDMNGGGIEEPGGGGAETPLVEPHDNEALVDGSPVMDVNPQRLPFGAPTRTEDGDEIKLDADTNSINFR